MQDMYALKTFYFRKNYVKNLLFFRILLTLRESKEKFYENCQWQIFTSNGYVQDGDNEHESYSEDLNRLHEGISLMLVSNGHIKEVNNSHKNKEDYYVKDDDVDIKGQLLQPIHNAKGLQKLWEILYNSFWFPRVNHLHKLIMSKWLMR